MSGKQFIGILATATLVYLGLKLLFGNKLMGSRGSGTEVLQQMGDEKTIAQLGKLSDLEAQFNGMIETSQSKEELELMIKATATAI